MIPEVFISYTLSTLDKLVDYVNNESKEKAFVKSTMKEALLGCCVDWKTRSYFTSTKDSDAKLKRYAEMLNTVSVKFHTADMLNIHLCERIWECTKKMVEIADEPKHQDNTGDPYEQVTELLFTDLKHIYEDFDELYEAA
ncbi:hypothetical protein SAMN02910340_00833 [Methanosarcina thermophila]|jgi:hypothetical protein|uniref:Uncharacterized protein n=1 Tax=Methanosarcina thermophila TaxID=2210 RepID=A0A1I6YF23_METTE|nr:hypothetical protein [Methanosarcina thermophila]ALK05329.1 MAG: hypothetical protein AAY43_05975 [Methanosarcina sp. 795]SFT49093.1 hypothetical protein SAMN02910340_00833 [Methanosarcina thermophila]